MSDLDRLIITLYQYLMNNDDRLRKQSDEAIYTICTRKKQNIDNINDLYYKFMKYQIFSEISRDITNILKFY